MDKKLTKGLRVFSALALTSAIAVGSTYSTAYAISFNQPVDKFENVDIVEHDVYNPSSDKLIDDENAHNSYNQPDFVVPDEEALDQATLIKGDLDGNGILNGTDAAMILDLYNKGDQTKEDLAVADMDNNDIINGADAAIILDMYNKSI